jgi:hypothetical protein
MSLVTGSPVGTVNAQETIFPYGAPNVYIQDSRATPLWNPDAKVFIGA